MGFNPFEEKGKPIEKQGHPWSELVSKSYNKDTVDEYTRLRLIAAYGMENEQWYFYHEFARNTGCEEMKAALAQIRRTEDQHRTQAAGWFDPSASVLEITIAFEHLAVDLTANVAKEEPDPYIKQVYDYGLLEDFDHLFRYSVLLDRLEGKDASKITRGLTEIKPGRPTWLEHLSPLDTLRNFADARTTQPLTKLHAMTVLAAEQQTRQYYASHGWEYADQSARQLYAEIGEIEEQHVTQYESIIDPNQSMLEMAIAHEYNEIYNYHGYIQSETDDRVKKVWEEHLSDELEHLRIFTELQKKMEGRMPQEVWPAELPKPIVLQPAKEYINEVLKNQVDLRAKGKEFVPKNELPENWPSYRYQKRVDINKAPSTQFVAEQEMARV